MTSSSINQKQPQLDSPAGRVPNTRVAMFDCWKGEHEIFLQGDFLGAESDDLSVVFHEDVLTVTSIDPQDPRTTDLMTTRPIKSEVQRGRWQRSFRVHEEINAAEIKATFENAVLTPIVQPPAPRNIPVIQF
jgi:HSP20 family molecular chaperone IbpA